MRIVLEDSRLISVDGVERLGSCNRCGLCCSVYEAGFPCRHLSFEILDGKQVSCELGVVRSLKRDS